MTLGELFAAIILVCKPQTLALSASGFTALVEELQVNEGAVPPRFREAVASARIQQGPVKKYIPEIDDIFDCISGSYGGIHGHHLAVFSVYIFHPLEGVREKFYAEHQFTQEELDWLWGLAKAANEDDCEGLERYDWSQLAMRSESEGLGPIKQFWQRRDTLKADIAMLEAEMEDRLRSLVPHELSTWLSQTALIKMMVHQEGVAWPEYYPDPDWGFADVDDIADKMRKLQRAWRGFVKVRYHLNKREGRVEVSFEAL
jgi:hypothetical protein